MQLVPWGNRAFFRARLRPPNHPIERGAYSRAMGAIAFLICLTACHAAADLKDHSRAQAPEQMKLTSSMEEGRLCFDTTSDDESQPGALSYRLGYRDCAKRTEPVSVSPYLQFVPAQ